MGGEENQLPHKPKQIALHNGNCYEQRVSDHDSFLQLSVGHREPAVLESGASMEKAYIGPLSEQRVRPRARG
jgi:hypothetical protein